jgi:hypothetical protein
MLVKDYALLIVLQLLVMNGRLVLVSLEYVKLFPALPIPLKPFAQPEFVIPRPKYACKHAVSTAMLTTLVKQLIHNSIGFVILRQVFATKMHALSIHLVQNSPKNAQAPLKCARPSKAA